MPFPSLNFENIFKLTISSLIFYLKLVAIRKTNNTNALESNQSQL